MNFPNLEQLFDLITSELPENLYAPDRATDPDTTKRSSSSAEIRTWATLFDDLYQNLLNIRNDKFITTATADGITQWERVLFSELVDSLLPLTTRRNNLLAKIRASGGISWLVINALVGSILDPLGIPFQVTGHCFFNDGAWSFGESTLGINTYLVNMDPLIGAAGSMPLDCSFDYVDAGLTAQQLFDIQQTAYTYEVRIMGNADADTLSFLDYQLTNFEPARSTHVIKNNFPGPGSDGIDGGTFIDSLYYAYLDFGLFTKPRASYALVDMGSF